jgi:hypothetical protein
MTEKTMDLTVFAEVAGKSALPFIYAGDRLRDEVCAKALERIGIGADSALAVFITNENVIGGIAIAKDALAYSGGGFVKVNDHVKMMRGAYPWSDYLVHDVAVKKTVLGLNIELTIWDKTKQKSCVFSFLTPLEEAVEPENVIAELTGMLETLKSSTGTEFGEPGTAEKNPNDYDFVYNDIHTTVTLNADSIIIKKMKIDDKTKIQTPKGEPVTIARSAIASVRLARTFKPVGLLGSIAAGAVIGFVFIGGIITLLICTLGGLIFSFPKTMIITRKDGTKFQTVISGDAENVKEYERLMAVIFG